MARCVLANYDPTSFRLYIPASRSRPSCCGVASWRLSERIEYIDIDQKLRTRLVGKVEAWDFGGIQAAQSFEQFVQILNRHWRNSGLVLRHRYLEIACWRDSPAENRLDSQELNS